VLDLDENVASDHVAQADQAGAALVVRGGVGLARRR
jgi:hypothetical protein